jgi:glycyl-tRNA synthetase beta chain
MSELLFEIGLEEVPARMLAGAESELLRRALAMLERERLIDPGARARSFSTPRRLAVLIAGVAASQPDITEDLMGPATKIAYKDGVPGPAAVAFAKKAGVAVETLKTVTTAKGEYLAATSTRLGRPASEVIAEEMPKELAGIYWAKNMYWRAGRPERFVRPLRWMVCLLGEVVVPVQFGGFTAANATRGHRILAGDAALPIGFPDEYEQVLLAASVLADAEARRHRIRKALDRVCRGLSAAEGSPNARWREDHALVDKLTHLTEWPSVIAGDFDPAYLSLPEEVLVTVMRDHQNYFAVEDGAGNLAPHFLAVLNTVTDPAGEAVIRHGNARVLRARFNDARFFWDFDQRLPLLDRVALLEKVTFQKDLGSYAAKTQRVAIVAEALAEVAAACGCAVDAPALREAVLLAKTDLTCDLVKEFTELQGIIGGLYARAQGFSPAIADAIYDQYKPVSMEDSVPRTTEGALLALADKADTIAGMFSLGLEPTGSRDPFALRRAANGIVKVLAEATPALPLTLGDIAGAATAAEPVRLKIEIFFAERLEFYLRETKRQAYDVVKAVLASGANDVRDAVARAEAVTAVRKGEDFVAVSAAFKRMKNILAQAQEKGIFTQRVEPPATVSMHPAQMALRSAAVDIASEFKMLAGRKDYVAALELLAALRSPIDRFFEEVMVMDDDAYTRRTRLDLLQGLTDTFSKVADFSEIVTAG